MSGSRGSSSATRTCQHVRGKIKALNFCKIEEKLVFLSGLIGYFCPLCLACKNANDLGESVPFYCCLICICSPIGICMLRQAARNKYGIEVGQVYLRSHTK